MPLTLTKRGRVWYVRGTVRGQSIFESTGLADERQAEAVRAQRESRLIEESVFGAKATATFLEAAVSHVAAGGSPRFIGTETEGLTGRFAHRKLHTITQADIDKAAAALYPMCSIETRIRQLYAPFIAVWNHAVRQKWAEPRQWQRPKQARGTTAIRLKPPRAGTRPVDYETAARFVAAMSPAPAMLMTTLFFTGMRPIELFVLDGEDINVAGRWITLPSSKTGEPRGVPLHAFLTEWIRPLVERGGPVFLTPRGAPYPPTEEGGGQIKTAVAGARKRSGILDVSPYTARHTVSTQLVIAGVHPHIKDQILGHAPDDMSRHYTNVPQQPLIEAIDKLPVPDAWRRLPWLSDPIGWCQRLRPWTTEQRARQSRRKRTNAA